MTKEESALVRSDDQVKGQATESCNRGKGSTHLLKSSSNMVATFEVLLQMDKGSRFTHMCTHREVWSFDK